MVFYLEISHQKGITQGADSHVAQRPSAELHVRSSKCSALNNVVVLMDDGYLRGQIPSLDRLIPNVELRFHIQGSASKGMTKTKVDK